MSESVHRGKAEHVAERLLERIVEAKLAPGSSFATEAELLAQFHVSRPTLRESLTILEAQGVLERRPGPGGGIIVRRPSIDTLAHALSIFLRVHEVPFAAVLKAREAIEPALAHEAALNGTTDDFDALDASIARMKALDGDQDAFLEENRAFHGLVARASGNRVLEAFWSTIGLLAGGEHHGVRYSMGNRAHVIAAHERIVAACRARDADAAAAQMGEHLASLENLVRSRYQHLLAHPTRVIAKPGRSIA